MIGRARPASAEAGHGLAWYRWLGHAVSAAAGHVIIPAGHRRRCAAHSWLPGAGLPCSMGGQAEVCQLVRRRQPGELTGSRARA